MNRDFTFVERLLAGVSPNKTHHLFSMSQQPTSLGASKGASKILSCSLKHFNK